MQIQKKDLDAAKQRVAERMMQAKWSTEYRYTDTSSWKALSLTPNGEAAVIQIKKLLKELHYQDFSDVDCVALISLLKGLPPGS